MNGKKGFSVIEVLVSVVLLSMLVLFIATFFIANINVISQTKDITTVLFSAQDQVEKVNKQLTDLMVERQGYYNQLAVDPGNDIAKAKVEEINTELARIGGTRREYNIFGRNIGAFALSGVEKDDAGATLIQLDTLVADTRQLVPDMPEIDQITIKVSGKDRVIYFPQTSDNAVSAFTYSKEDGRYMEVYQWFAAQNRYHSELIAGAPEDIDGKQPSPPAGAFDLLSGQQGSILDKVNDYVGRFIACSIMPVTKTGVYGRTKTSNYIYISGLPELTERDANYLMLIDSSFFDITPSIPMGEGGTQEFTKILNQNPNQLTSLKNAAFSVSKGKPYIDLKGANTSNSPKATDYSYARYIACYGKDTTKAQIATEGITSAAAKDNLSVYAVVRSAEGKEGNFISDVSGSNMYLDLKKTGSVNSLAYPPITNELLANKQWTIVSNKNLPLDTKNLIIGGDDAIKVDIAEFIMVKDASGADHDAILKYLKNKYLIY